MNDRVGHEVAEKLELGDDISLHCLNLLFPRFKH